MKRSPIKRRSKLAAGKKAMRRTQLARGSLLQRGSKKLPRARLRQVGKRGRAVRRQLKTALSVVIQRDGRICARCQDERCKPLDLHHLVGRGRGGSHEPENLVLLGRPCHDLVGTHEAKDWKRWIRSGKGLAR